jgi:hypothetical protein
MLPPFLAQKKLALFSAPLQFHFSPVRYSKTSIAKTPLNVWPLQMHLFTPSLSLYLSFPICTFNASPPHTHGSHSISTPLPGPFIPSLIINHAKQYHANSIPSVHFNKTLTTKDPILFHSFPFLHCKIQKCK